MSKMRNFILTIIAFHLAASYGFCGETNTYQEKQSASLVENFQWNDIPNPISGCSCYFYSESYESKLIFASDMGRNTWMKLDGNLVKINLVKPHITAGNQGANVGDKNTYYYNGNDIDVVIELEVTKACAPQDEKCEGKEFTGVFTAIKGNTKHTVTGNGSCGC